MAGPTTYTAVLDACVLYPAPLRDILLSLADAGLFHARWTVDIQDEWTRNLLSNRPDLNAEQLRATQERMIAAIPDCLITRYEPLIAGLSLPDANDRHVLAAAITGHADVIVTLNLKDFPADTLADYNLEAQHPDNFVMNQLELREYEALAAIKRMRAEYERRAIRVITRLEDISGVKAFPTGQVNFFKQPLNYVGGVLALAVIPIHSDG